MPVGYLWGKDTFEQSNPLNPLKEEAIACPTNITNAFDMSDVWWHKRIRPQLMKAKGDFAPLIDQFDVW